MAAESRNKPRKGSQTYGAEGKLRKATHAGCGQESEMAQIRMLEKQVQWLRQVAMTNSIKIFSLAIWAIIYVSIEKSESADSVAATNTISLLSRQDEPFLIGNGVTPAQPYPCDANFSEQLKDKQPWPLDHIDLLYYPHRVVGLDTVLPANVEFVAKNLLPYAPGLIFSGATVMHGDVTFRPEEGPKNLGLAEPFNKYSIARQVELMRTNGLIPARHLSLAGMIAEELPPDARERGFYTELKTSAVGPIRAGHTMVIPNYTNPAVLNYLEQTFDILTDQAGFRYYWMDNWQSADPKTYPTVYQAVRAGCLLHGHKVILRSGAGPSQVGLTDVMAPAPDVQDAWHYVVAELNQRIIGPYVQYCPDAFKIGFDDFYIDQPFDRDQARFLASLYALPGVEITITEGSFYETPPDRIAILQKVLPLPITGPLQALAPEGSRIWVECIQRPFEKWWVAGFFNPDLFQPRDLELDLNKLDEPAGPVLAWDFWDQRFLGAFKDKIRVRLGPSSCLVLGLRKQQDVPQLLSTSRHILQGADELSDCAWNSTNDTLTGTFTRGVAGVSFSLFIHVPAGWKLDNAGGAVVKAIDYAPEVLRADLQPGQEAMPWSLTFTHSDDNQPDAFRTSTVTNTLGELVTASSDLAGAWKNQGTSHTRRIVIPKNWNAGTIRIYFTSGEIEAVRLNGSDCSRVEDPARKFTAWYTTESESVFAFPPSAVRWGKENQLEVVSSDKSWQEGAGKAGLQLDLSP
jgi:hypothetical protein